MATTFRRLAGRSAIMSSALLLLFIVPSATSALAASQVPFNANFAGSFSPTLTGFDVAGTGIATHLGDSRNSGVVAMLNESNGSCPDTGFVVRNDEILTSMDGSQMTVSILDNPCPVSPGHYYGVGTYVVTGGTGRFAGASGQGTFVGVGDFTNDTFTYAFKGTVSVSQ